MRSTIGICLYLSALTFMFVSNGSVNASLQALGPPLDPTPFSPPKPFCEMKALVKDEPGQTMRELKQIMADNGYEVSDVDLSYGSFVATRISIVAKPGQRSEDRILLWLDRHPQNPQRFRLYLEYGWYVEYFGKPDLLKAKPDPQIEKEALAKVKQAIQRLADGREK